jgi:hypothetical protein
MVGSGAGRYPTANSVVADVVAVRDMVDMGAGRAKNPFGHKVSNERFDADFSCKFYVRAVSRESLDEVHVAFRQADITFTDVSDLAFITDPCECSKLSKAVPPHMVDIVMQVL